MRWPVAVERTLGWRWLKCFGYRIGVFSEGGLCRIGQLRRRLEHYLPLWESGARPGAVA